MYSNPQTKFSNIIHDKLIENKFYHELFETNKIEIINTTVTKEGYNKEAQMLDQQYGVDYRIIANFNDLPIPITIQERFRQIKYQHYQELTIRSQTKTGLLSELSKINADFMIYGYSDNNNIKQILAINMPIVKLALIHKKLNWKMQINYDHSKFIAIKFDNLYKINAVTKEINYD